MELYIVSLVHAESFYKRISASIFFLFICIFMHAQKTVKGKEIFYVQNYTEALAKKYFDTDQKYKKNPHSFYGEFPLQFKSLILF